MIRSPQAVLDFWFGDQTRAALDARAKLWFGGGAKADQEVAARFKSTLEALAAGEALRWAREGPRQRLGAIIALDQFTRSIWRRSPAAFANDPLALSLTKDAIAGGEDASLTPVERWFLLMPLEHSEAMADQRQSLEKFAALQAGAPPEVHDLIAGAHDYAKRHARVIETFGRFPHRNAVLGRATTPEEAEFLKQEGGF